MTMPEIKFGKLIYKEHEGGTAYVASIANVNEDDFYAYINKCNELGFKLFKEHNFGEAVFKILTYGEDLLLLSFYKDIAEMRIVEEEKSNYLSFKDESKSFSVAPLLTHIDLEDFGLSYVVRVSDGRFIIFDGGWEFEPDADKLMDVLLNQSSGEKPKIAAWIFTHPHLDHYRCFLSFYKKYKDSVVIERFIYNFPDVTDESIEKFPCLLRSGDAEKIKELYSYVEEISAPVYRAHSGQIYNIGDAALEILSSPDDCLFCPVEDFNHVSLIIKMTIAGQSILWGGDAFFGIAKLAERYGDYLKSDIFQIAHHGFGGGRTTEHALIDPAVCLAPVFEDDCFSYINIYNEYNKQLFFDLNVLEVIVGAVGNRVLKLPYTPPVNAKQTLFKTIEENQNSIGKKSWIFMEVSKDEADFSILNSTSKPVIVNVNLYFDDANDKVYGIKVLAKPSSVTRVNLFDEKTANPDAMFYNPRSLKKIGLKNGAIFTAMFRSKVPVVIKGKNMADHSC